ncbi:flagellar protein FlaG [Fusibacter tunisiensis]|uniref:Flagellar protein FlaG n=1 Tax=Fusibacter tunisiensis TaxID=1008308 RepID=A0ABS2MPJ5_9FIRM|nr:flagellar protein FlaG [Fusibacter tunisiensis]MBM7561331.1 flagellar protein FlaG [Fusibacter tunisiensis]
MKINHLNAGNVAAAAPGTDAQIRRTGQESTNPKPVERIKQDVKENINVDKMTGKEPVKEFFDEDMLDKSVEQANKSLEIYNRRIERAVHEVTHAVMYTVKDTVTNEVIQEFPPRKIQDMIAKMWELAGLFVDEKA